MFINVIFATITYSRYARKGCSVSSLKMNETAIVSHHCLGFSVLLESKYCQ